MYRLIGHYINKYKMCIGSGNYELAVLETSIRSRYKRKCSIIVQLHYWGNFIYIHIK